MNHQEAIIRAIAALKANNENLAAKVLEDELLITEKCQYCDTLLFNSFETVTLQDTCENCWYVSDIHPAVLKKKLLATIERFNNYNAND